LGGPNDPLAETLTVSLSELIRQRFDRDAAWKAQSRLLKGSGTLEAAFNATVPLIRLCRTNIQLWSVDQEDVDAYMASSLWFKLKKRRYALTENANLAMGYWRTVLRNFAYAFRRIHLSKKFLPDGSTDRVMAERNMSCPRDGGAIATENKIFVEELPEAIWKAEVRCGARISEAEAPAFRYIIERMFHGERPTQERLHLRFKLEYPRGNFLLDYAVLAIRRQLNEMYEDFPEVLLRHPVVFLLQEDEDADDGTDEQGSLFAP